MTVTAVGSATANPSAGTPRQTERTLELGQDAFLKLLITQLKYQDPLSPMDDREFIAQLAQFSSLSELQKLNQAVEEMVTIQALADAASLVGKRVSGLASNGQRASGTVEAALLREGEVRVRVGGEELALSSIEEVTQAGGSDG